MRRKDSYAVVASFMAGFRREEIHDLINGFYLAARLLKRRPNIRFESYGTRGVESVDIRKMMFYNKSHLKSAPNDDEQYRLMGVLLSGLGLVELALAAQFRYGGKHHLFPYEAKYGKLQLKKLRELAKLGATAEQLALIVNKPKLI